MNLENVIPEAERLRIPREIVYQSIEVALITNSGLGATNSAIILKKL